MPPCRTLTSSSIAYPLPGKTPSPLMPRPPSPALLLPELSGRASGLSTTPTLPFLRHPLLQPTLACLAWMGWRSGGGESPPPAKQSQPSQASAPTATSTTPPLPSTHLPPGSTLLRARPASVRLNVGLYVETFLRLTSASTSLFFFFRGRSHLQHEVIQTRLQKKTAGQSTENKET